VCIPLNTCLCATCHENRITLTIDLSPLLGRRQRSLGGINGSSWNTNCRSERSQIFYRRPDLSRSDRRSDGPALSNFFDVEAGSITVNNVRRSRRLKKKREVSPVGNVDPPAGSITEALPEGNRDATTLQHVPNEEPGSTPKVISGRKQSHGDGYVTQLANFTLRRPKAGIRCSGRNDTTRLLWLHEFYVVHEGSRCKEHNYIYEAVQFLLGEHIPVGEVDNMTDRM
jgi:hypothetical protein